tara:strand:+ start:68097 stop:68393 length:297 start_codon:yes stop_codon:yes gene_type:complete
MAEAAVWTMLRNRRLEVFKFRRQMPVGPYVADFCCPSLKLIIELDGGVHALRTERDARRDQWLTAVAGFTVLRFANEAILNNPALLFDAVRQHAVRRQ